MKPYLCWMQPGHERCADINRQEFVDDLIRKACCSLGIIETGESEDA